MPLATDVYITPASKKIEFYQSSALKAQISGSNGDIYVSGAADVILDAAGLDVLLKTNGTLYGKFSDNNAYWDINGSAGTSYLRLISSNGGGGTTAYTHIGDGTYNQYIYVRSTSNINTNDTTIANSFFKQTDSAGNTDTYIQAGGNSYINGGNLGIGTTSPSTKLHVVGDALIDGYLHADKDGSPGLLVGEGGDADIYYDGTDMNINPARVGSGILKIATNTSIAGNLMFPDSNNTISAFGSDNLYLRAHNDMYFNIDTPNDSTSRHFIFRANTSSEIMRLGEDLIAEFKGDVGIGTAAPGETLHVEGTTRITGKAVFGATTLPTNNGIRVNDTLELPQKSVDPTNVSNSGVLWVKSTSPTTLHFMASDGTDTDLTAGGGGGTFGGSLSSGKLAIGTGTDTIGNFVDALTENDSIYIGANPASTTNTAQNNTALGISALNDITTGDNNVAIGIQAGQKTTTQERNTIMGVSALRYASGSASYNVAIGYATMGASDQEGSQNTAVGYYALSGATGANAVTAVGHLAARDLTTGDSHVAIGKSAMLKVTTSSYNTVVGVDALSDVDGAGSTTAVGFGAMKYSSADNATGIGQYALSGATGDKNAALGNSAGAIAKGSANSVMVGYQAGFHPTGNHNTWMGYKAGYGVVDQGAQNNVGIGKEAMLNVTTGQENVAVGDQAAYAVTTGQYNVAIGSDAFRAATTANYNVAIGKNAMNAGTLTTNHNVAIGYNAASSAVSALENVAIGSYAAQDLTTGPYNVFVGTYAGTGNTTGQENVAIGHSALQENQEGDDIVAVGRYALYNNNPTAGAGDNVAVGSSAGFTSTTGVQNVFIGRKAGYLATTANNLVLIGREAGYKITTGSSNVLIGMRSGYNVTKGTENVMIGTNAGLSYEGTTSGVYGSFSTIIGFGAAQGVTGNHSYGNITAVGHQALFNATSANRVIAVGSSAGVSGTSALDNVYVGGGAGAYADSTGSTYIGHKAGFRSNGNYNTVVGYRALSGSSSGDTSHNNVAIGYVAMEDSTAAVENVVIGTFAGTNMTTASFNTIVGPYAGRDITAGNRNVALGYAAMNEYKQTGDGYNVSLGMYSMMNVETGSANIAIGYQALRGVTGQDVDYNVAIGDQTLYSITTGDSNTAVGRRAGVTLTTGGDNVLIGYEAGENISTATASTLVGYKAGYSNNANSLVAVGKNAGFSNSSGGNNTFMGFSAGHSNSTGASNVMLGYQAGYPINANNNVVIGTNAGVAATSTTNDSVLIGVEAGYSTAGNQIAIGRQALYYPEGNYNVAIGQEAMHGASATVTAQQNVAIGRQAARSTTSGYSNTSIGYQTSYSMTTGAGNTHLGNQAGFSGSTHNNTIFIGNSAGLKNNSNDNVAIGAEAFLSGSSATNIVAIGRNAGKGITTGQGVIAIGHDAAKENESGTHNIAIGWQAMVGNTGVSNRNIGIGTSSLLRSTTGDDNTMIGYQAGNNITTGEYNVAVGSNNLNNLATASNNTAIGYNAGHETTTADNVWVGYQAGYHSESSGSVAVGKQAGYFPHGNHNTFIGFKAGMGDSSTTTAHNNVAVGREALTAASSAEKNTIVGTRAAAAITTQNASVYVGFEAGLGQQSGSGGNVALGHHSLYSGTQNYQNTAIGIYAGRKATGASANNVYLGSAAGPSSTGAESNKLYIHNAEGTPLIGGDFSAGTLNIDGTLDTAGLFTAASGINVAGGSLTTPSLAMGVTVTEIKDEDNMASNSATMLATQQSIKAYVDANAGGGGGGDVTKVGTPVNNQIGVWTGDGTIEGDSDLTWDDSKLIISTATDDTVVLKLLCTEDTANSGPIFDLSRELSANQAADGDELGKIRFRGDKEDGSAVSYATIKGVITDSETNSPDGRITFSVMKQSSQTDFVNFGIYSPIGGNESIWPESDNTVNLGFSSKAWRDVFSREYHGYNGSSYDVGVSMTNQGGSISQAVDIDCTDASTGAGAHLTLGSSGGIISLAALSPPISDLKYKENIKDFNKGLDFLETLPTPKYFDFKEEVKEVGKKVANKNVLGFIAQEIEEVHPDVVKDITDTPDVDTYKSLDYKTLEKETLYALINSVKELSAKNDALEARIKALEG